MTILFTATVKVQSSVSAFWKVFDVSTNIVRIPKHVALPGLRWYILRADGSYEKKAALALQLFGLAGHIPDFELVRQVWIPQTTIDQPSPSSGKIIKKSIVLVPGYLFIEAILSYRLYASLKRPDLPHLYGWLQPGNGWPSEVSSMEVKHLATIDLVSDVIEDIPFEVGNVVCLPWINVVGTITDINSKRVVVTIEMFGRALKIDVQRRFFSELIKQ